jgi:hypothetical protein
MGGCCFARQRVMRCNVVIRAQMLGPCGTARTSAPRDSMAMLAAVPRINEDGVASAASADLPPFTPPTSFPGLSTTLAAALKRASRAADVAVTKVSVAPTAGGLYCVTISAAVDVTFKANAAAGAAAWGEALQPPAVEGVEEQVAAALSSALPEQLEAILTVAVSAPGTRRDENSVRHARRPSTVALRVSANHGSLESEIAAAPPGTFPPVPPRDPAPPPLS